MLRRALHWLIAGLIAVFILSVTVSPLGRGVSNSFAFCIACGKRGLSDGILNFWLFVPLGVIVGWNARSLRTGFLVGLVLSTAIELGQIFMPGRDPSLSDIVFNTLGASAGAAIAFRPRVWLLPDARTSRMLTRWSLAAAAAVMLVTAFLLSPAGPPRVSRFGSNLLLSYRTHAHGIGLDEPEYWLMGAFAHDTAMAAVSIKRERAHWAVNVGTGKQSTLGPTPGLGWTMLIYPRGIGRRWGRIVTEVWMIALCLPIGFLARGRVLVFAAAGITLVLLLIPPIMGIVAAAPAEWLGAGIGFVAGALLGLLSSRVSPLFSG